MKTSLNNCLLWNALQEQLSKERGELQTQKEQFYYKKRPLEAIDKIGAIVAEAKGT